MENSKTRRRTARVGFSININFNLRQKTPKSALTSLHCIIRYNNNRIVIPNVAKIKPDDWNQKTQAARKQQTTTGGELLNDYLKREREKIQDIFKTYTTENDYYPETRLFKALCKDALDKDLTPKTSSRISDLLSFTEQFIEDSRTGVRQSDKGGVVSPNTLKIYRTFKNNLIAFKEKYKYNLQLDNITLDFFEDFKEYMIREKNYSTNTVAKHIRTIKTIMNDARERGLTSTEFRGKRYRAKTEVVETIYLNESELDALFQLDLSINPRLDKVRDLFLVGCWTGLRFSDFSMLESKHFNKGYINIKTQKTGNKVVVPIHPVVNAVIEKYKDLTENSLPPTISNQKMNAYLKEIGEHSDLVKAGFQSQVQLEYTKGGVKVIKQVPKHTLISSHTARRSFATNMYRAGIPSLTIMAITGHKTESAFMKYIRLTPTEHAEKLKELWSRPKMKVVNK